MMEGPDAEARAQAERLLRWYPKEWRNRYGEEFSELLAAEIADQPRSRARTLDVYRGAMMARSASLGLSGTTVDPLDLPRRSVATLGCALAVFLTFALSIWSNLTIAWKSSAPTTSATHAALIIMNVAVAVSLATAFAGFLPVAWAAIGAARRSESQTRLKVVRFLSGTAILIIGAVAFHHGWSTGSQPRLGSTGPDGPASYVWASTLTVSAYWAHPATLLGLPPSQIAWMAVSPIALVLSVSGAAGTVRKLDMSARLLRFLTHTAHIAVIGPALFVFGTLIWLVEGGPGPAHLFQAGSVDRIGLVIMTVTLVTALRAMQGTGTAPATLA